MTHVHGDDDPDLARTVFVNMKIINRSDQSFEDVRFGMFTDFSIGCPDDDFAGCDTLRDLYFAYNWSDIDPGCWGISGYGDQPPAQGVKFLNTAMSSHRTMSFNGPPVAIDDLFDGTLNGDAFEYDGTSTNFQFPGGPYVETTPTAATGRASMGAAGPFTFAPGDTLCFDIAFLFARATTGGALASVEALRSRADAVQAFYDAQNIACGSYPIMTWAQTIEPPFQLHLHPNPARSQVQLQGSEGLGHITVLDAQGRTIRSYQSNEHYLTIEVGAMVPGLYLIRTANERGITTIKLIIE